MQKQNTDVYYDKKDIMKILNCKSDKALKILKLIYSIKDGNKIGREYYVKKEVFDQFLGDMKGKEINL